MNVSFSVVLKMIIKYFGKVLMNVSSSDPMLTHTTQNFIRKKISHASLNSGSKLLNSLFISVTKKIVFLLEHLFHFIGVNQVAGTTRLLHTPSPATSLGIGNRRGSWYIA